MLLSGSVGLHMTPGTGSCIGKRRWELVSAYGAKTVQGSGVFGLEWSSCFILLVMQISDSNIFE
jgi:hypothetical protein